jgi:hypothetical protein
MSVSLLATGAMLGAMGLSLGLAALPAQAAPSDYAPGFNDVVGVGSDTLQFIVDFGDDGDPSGDTGYNGAGNLYKVVSFDATADSNARAAYLNNSTDGNLLPLDPTDVLRGGTFPIERINGSGAGISALLADTALTDPYIDFVRMSSEPTATEESTAASQGWGGLQIFQLGNENLSMAKQGTSTTSESNAPAGLSVPQLAQIYECNPTGELNAAGTGTVAADDGFTQWNFVGGTSTDQIIPIIPQAGSGTRSTFLADIGISNAQLGPCVVTGEENDPTAITGLSSVTSNPITSTACSPNCAYDAIEPFSGARLNLWLGKSGNTADGSNPSSGYFHVPTTPYPGGAVETPGVVLMCASASAECEATTGEPSGSLSTVSPTATYDDQRALNIVYRWSDQTSSTPWQPGGTENWAETLFCNPGGTTVPFYQTPAGKTLIAEAGANPATQSCLSSPAT